MNGSLLFLHLTLLSMRGLGWAPNKTIFPPPGTHLRLYCEQRSAAAGTEWLEAEIILSAISYKYLTEEGAEGEMRIEEEARRSEGKEEVDEKEEEVDEDEGGQRWWVVCMGPI